MADCPDNKKDEVSYWRLFLYIIGALLGITLMYYLLSMHAGGAVNSNGRRDLGKTGMFLVAGIMAVFIIYFVITSVINEYNDTISGEPWLVETTKNAQSMTIIPGKKIPKSKDGKFGIEFTYSMWIYINEWNSNSSRFVDGEHHILHKGNITAIPNQCPGIWLKKDTNTLVLKMNTFYKNESDSCKVNVPKDDSCWLEKCYIPNIPVHKWVHVTVSVINRNVDIYVNGFLKKRCLLKGIPRQNYGDVYLNAFGGFNGFMSRVRYFNYALPIWKIEQVIKQGPSDAPCVNTGEKPPYLAQDWWEQTHYPTSAVTF
jgi:hypothetical protein